MRNAYLQQAAQDFLDGKDELILPHDIAAELEDRSAVGCNLSKYKRKTQDDWRVHLTQQGRNGLLAGMIRKCGGEGDYDCAECGGDAQHLRYSYEYAPCGSCDGTGNCPCDHGFGTNGNHSTAAEVVALFEGVL